MSYLIVANLKIFGMVKDRVKLYVNAFHMRVVRLRGFGHLDTSLMNIRKHLKVNKET